MSESQENKTAQGASSKRIKHLSQDTAAELDINMVIHDNLGAQERHVRIPRAQISKYYGSDQDISVIELAGGEKFYTTLSFDDLCARMDKAHTSRNKRIDLREHTGRKAHRIILERGLSKVFDMEAMDRRLEEDDLLIVMYAYGDRESTASSARRVVFLRSDINKMTDKEDGVKYLHLSNWSQYREEWGMPNLSCGPFINIGVSTLTEHLKDAERSGMKILDLSVLTAPEDVSAVRLDVKVSEAARPLRKP